MPEISGKADPFQVFTDRMQEAGLSGPAIESFRFHLTRLSSGDDGLLTESQIEPVKDLADAGQFEEHRALGIDALAKTAVVKLNGGLGTGMGLDRARTLLRIRGELTFLDLVAGQILSLRRDFGAKIPLLLMNSFRTEEDSNKALEAFPELALTDLPLGFLQNRVPKVLADHMLPARQTDRTDLEWCPPGHGDLYTSIADSGLLGRLLDRDIEYAFVSNADNLGAVLDPSLLGFMVENEVDFMLEAADRTSADRKGGHLCRLGNGRLALRESAQCPPEETSFFQDIERYSYFNTNNIWLHLPTLSSILKANRGFLRLSTIVNRKTLDPRDPTSPGVFQLETAMGSAISLFDRATAIRVPRRRFSPVKNTNDLLAVRSDAYETTDDSRVVLSPDRAETPLICLDDDYFKMIDRFEERFPYGPPSLRRCDSLTVEGDVAFGQAITVEGAAVIRATHQNARVPDGAVVRGILEL